MSDTLRVSNLSSSAVGIGTAAGAAAACMTYTTGGSNLFQATSSYTVQTAAFNIYNTSYSASNLWQLLMVGSGATLAPAGSLAFYTPTISSNGGIGMVMTPAGSIGIGTTVPVCPLEVTGIIRASNKAYSGITSGSGIELVYDSGGSINCCTRGSGSSFTGQSLSYGALSHSFYVGTGASTNGLFITSGGNVGIGTAAPSQPASNPTFFINGAGNSNFTACQFYLQNSTTPMSVLMMSVTSSTSQIQSYLHNTGGGPQYLCLNPLGGNVGIGKTIPATQLDVTGYLSINNGVAAVNAGQYQGIQIYYTGTGSTGYANIFATNPGATYNPICLNPNGGGVCIGQTTSVETLTVNTSFGVHNATSGYFQVGLAGGQGQYSAAAVSGDSIIRAISGNLIIQTGSGQPGIYINSSNQIGIGTNNPGQTLDVYGTIARSGLKLPRVDYGTLSAAASITIPILFSDTQYNMVEIRIKYNINTSNVSITMAATSTQPAALTFSESGLTTIPYNNQAAPTYYVTATTSTSVILFANNVESAGTYGNVLFRIIRPDATTGGYYRHHFSYDNVYCWSTVGTARGSGMGHIDNMSYSLASITLAPGSGTITCTYSTTHYN